MKTLNEIKEDVAKSIGETSWESYRKHYIISERTFERVAHLFAREALDAAAEMIKNDDPFYQYSAIPANEDIADDILKLKDQLK